MDDAIIFFRRFNDFDHTVPIIKYLSEQNLKINFHYICTSDSWDYTKNSSYEFIKDSKNIKSYYFNDFFFKSIFFKVLKYFKNYSIINYIFKFFILKKLNSLNLKFILIDFPNKRKGFLKDCIDEATKLKIKVFGFRHALWNRVINDSNTEDINNLKKLVYENSDLHKLIFSNKTNLDYAIKYGNLKPNKGIYLGNPRYSNEWHHKVMSKYNLEKQISDEIRICYMDHSSYLGMNTDNIYKSMKILSSLKNVKLVIKPNTNSEHKNTINLSTNKLQEFDLKTNKSSVEIINWADIIICTQSSIAVEVLLQKKLLISASHYHYSNQLWDYYKSACLVNNDQEILDIIKKYENKKNFKNFYKEENINAYLNEIQANDLNGNVFERFENTLLNKNITKL